MAQGNPALPAGLGVSGAGGGLITEPFNGTPGGSNLALPQHELDDTEARIIQDGLVDYPGLTRRRGPVRKATGVASISRKGSGLVMTLNPQGIDRYGVLNGDNANGYFSVLSDDLTSVQADLAWPHPLPANPPSTPYRIVDAKPALNGGAWIGVSSDYGSNSPNQGLALWMGANRANYAGTVKVARGSANMTLPSGANANVVAGMWVFADTDEGYTQTLIGLVKSVNSDTSITLDQVSPYNVGISPATFKTATFQALRGFAPKAVTGRLTVDTTSTQVIGGATKFLSQNLDVGIWQLYRAKDMAFVGKVTSVQSEFALTLTANAAVAMAEDSYIAIRADADYSIVTTANKNKVGFLNATYAGRQWYGNNGSSLDKTSRLSFSDTNDPEAVDLSDFDGDWDDVTSSSTVNEPLRAIAPANNGLLVFKENETFIVTGNSPSTFSPKKLEDDGALSGMSVQQYGGGVIWAGREGIHFYDGIQPQNLIASKLGDYWKNTIKTFDPSVYRMWSMVDRDHYFLFVEDIHPTVAIVKGVKSTTPTRYTFVINMTTRAVTFMTNVNIRGAVTLPAAAGKHTWYLVNGRAASDNADHAFIADGEALFNEEGVDPITADMPINLLSQPGFEDGVSLWSTSGGGETLTADSADSAFGDQSAVLTAPIGARLAWARQKVSLVSGKTYSFSVYVKGTPGQKAQMWVWDFAGHGTGIVSITLDGSWQRIVQPPFTSAFTSPDYWFIIDTDVAGNPNGVSIRADGAQVVEGATPITFAEPGQPGPDFFFESKKFDAGDPTRLKKFKQLMLHYLVQGGDIRVDTVIGLNNLGQTLTGKFPASVLTWDKLRAAVTTWDGVAAQFPTWDSLIQGVYEPKRVKFQKDSQHLSFRLWQSNSSITRLQIGPYHIAYKMKRPGRV